MPDGGNGGGWDPERAKSVNNAVPLSYSLPFGPICVLNACQIPNWAFVRCLLSLKEAVTRFLSLLRLFRQEIYLFLCILLLFLKKKLFLALYQSWGSRREFQIQYRF